MTNKFRIHEKLIKLRISKNYQKIVDEVNDDSITIETNVLISRFLRNFGHLISRIAIIASTIDSNSIERVTTFINGQINKYCFESLTKMTLHNGNNWDINWKNPFKKLTTLQLRSLSLSCETENNMKNLSKIFPSLKRLSAPSAKPSVLKCFEYRLPHLEYVELPFYSRIYDDAFPPYERFMKANPHIRKVSVMSGYSVKLFRIMSVILENLEALHFNTYLGSFPIDNNPIVFEGLISN